MFSFERFINMSTLLDHNLPIIFISTKYFEQAAMLLNEYVLQCTHRRIYFYEFFSALLIPNFPTHSFSHYTHLMTAMLNFLIFPFLSLCSCCENECLLWTLSFFYFIAALLSRRHQTLTIVNYIVSMFLICAINWCASITYTNPPI